MTRRWSLFKTVILLSAIVLSYAQDPDSPAPIAYEDTCMIREGVTDNLSCRNANNEIQCFPRTQLCDGTEFCNNGIDENRNFNDLDCE